MGKTEFLKYLQIYALRILDSQKNLQVLPPKKNANPIASGKPKTLPPKSE